MSYLVTDTQGRIIVDYNDYMYSDPTKAMHSTEGALRWLPWDPGAPLKIDITHL